MTEDKAQPASASAPRRPPKGRSPSYPAIPLQQAIERARILYDKERQHSAPMATITGHWGFKSPTTGPASVTYAALKKFGLLVEEGSGVERQGRLTRLAVEILRNPDPRQAIQEAALAPPIHRELWTEFGYDLPSDDNLVWRLLQRGFTDSGAKDFIREYRATLDFAQLEAPSTAEPSPDQRTGQDEDDQWSEAEDPEDPEDETPPRIKRSDPERERRDVDDRSESSRAWRIPLPLVGGQSVVIEAEFPISESAWDQLIAVLTAMKPGLVREQAEP
jgi:hypothetical protein